MAKATRGLRGQIAEIRAGKKAMDKEAGVEYGVTKSANKAGVANLNAQLGRINRQLLGTTKRTTKQVGHLTQRSKAVERQTRAKQDAAVGRYGTSLAGSVNQQFQSAEATSAAGVQTLRGARTVAARGANMAQGVIGIAAQGAKAQKASGEYALAQALQARYKVSAETAFAAEQQIRLAQLEFEQQKKLQDLQNKEESGGAKGVRSAVEMAETAAPDLMRFLNDPGATQSAGRYATPAEAAAAYMAEQGYTPESNEGRMILALTQKLWAEGAGFVQAKTDAQVARDEDGDGWVPRLEGVSADEQPRIIQQAAGQVFGNLYPEMWKKHKEDILDTIGTGVAAWQARESAPDIRGFKRYGEDAQAEATLRALITLRDGLIREGAPQSTVDAVNAQIQQIWQGADPVTSSGAPKSGGSSSSGGRAGAAGKV